MYRTFYQIHTIYVIKVKRKKLTFINKCAETGETLDELRERIGEEEFAARVDAAHDRAMAAAGYVPIEKEAAQ